MGPPQSQKFCGGEGEQPGPPCGLDGVEGSRRKIIIKIASDYLGISPYMLTLDMRNDLLPIGLQSIMRIAIGIAGHILLTSILLLFKNEQSVYPKR